MGYNGVMDRTQEATMNMEVDKKEEAHAVLSRSQVEQEKTTDHCPRLC